MVAPPLIAQLSDPHLRAGDAEREASFGAAVDRVRRMQPAPAVVVVTGDIADAGEAGAYDQAVRALAALEMPVVVIPGNHDDRPAMRAAFDLPGSPEAPITGEFAFGGSLRVIAADTLVPGQIGGALHVDWVAELLDAAPATPTLIAMHHPPISVGFPAMDRYGFPDANRDAFATLLERSPQVVGVIAGHVHRAASTTVGGRPLFVAPSTNLQLDLRLDAGTVLETNDDPPGIALHLLVDGRLVSHVQPLPRS